MKPLKVKGTLAVVIAVAVLWTAGQAWAQTVSTDESALFTSSTQPDALILLDLSGSMAWNPAGGTNTYGISSCAASTTYCTGGSSCSSGFCSSSKTNCSTDCSRLAIAKRSIFSILDDNNDNTINSTDETSLAVRIGYMHLYNCSSDDTSSDYTSGCVQIPGSSSTSRRYIGSKYSQIYCNSNTSCTGSSTGSYAVGGESASGGTPLASALRKAKVYLDANKAADSAASCRKKFVIVITDGSDTYACSSDGSECSAGRYKNRRETVAQAKVLADAGYKVFVVGFGSGMPSYLQNTLNWMAYYGGTDNPDLTNSGSTSGYTPGTPGACSAGTSPATDTCYDSSNPSGTSTANFKDSTNDPGYATLSGYAFLATNADELAASLKSAMTIIRQSNYSFSQSSVQSSRTSDENFLYEGSFEPIDGDPFWLGHLKKYTINSDGTVGALSSTWTNGDTGSVLQATNATSRNIVTYKGGSLIQFSTPTFTVPTVSWALTPSSSNTATYVTATDVGAASDTARDATVGYIRGNSTYNPDNWKLGDVFRSTPITVGTPSAYFEDTRDCNNRFSSHRSNNQRTSALGNRLIVVGANAGQFHAFKTSDGTEAWSFVPQSLMTKLKNLAHSSEPTSLTHQFFVDGPVTVADVWSGADDGNCGTSCSANGNCKSANSWRTLLAFGLARGAVSYSWSDSAYCDSGLFATYTTTATDGSTLTHPYYCGYYALNVTNALSPTYLWNGPTFTSATTRAAQAPYIGDPWSKMMTGRVWINDGGVVKEKWVGFIGAGYNAAVCSSSTCDTRGKGFFVVDLTNGNILWSYTYANDTNMAYGIPGDTAIVDTDNDGFIDTAYIGDLGGNMWRFTFCRYADMPSCGISGSGLTKTWGGGRFFASSSGYVRPIYISPAAAKDSSGNLWIYWGTGDKTDVTDTTTVDRYFALKDNRTSTYTISNLDDISSSSATYSPTTSTNMGFFITLPGSGEKILADPTVYGGVVYFTTYRPSSTVCNTSGVASLYGINYTTGAGALSGARSMTIGTGIPSAPVLSLKPGSSSGIPDLFVTTSGGGTTSASTQRVNITPAGVSNRSNMLYWRDQRIQ